jgi:hypothetical protein
LQHQAWVVGFLSGVGFVGQNGDDPSDGVDADGIWAWIDNYCRAHPIEGYRDGGGGVLFRPPAPLSIIS